MSLYIKKILISDLSFLTSFYASSQCRNKVAKLLTCVLLGFKYSIIEKTRTYITKYEIKLLQKGLLD